MLCCSILVFLFVVGNTCANKQQTFSSLNSKVGIPQEDWKCDICTIGIIFAEEVVSTTGFNATVIELGLMELCTFLPAKYATKCELLVKKDGGVFIELLMQHTDPNFICTYLNYCNASSTVTGVLSGYNNMFDSFSFDTRFNWDRGCISTSTNNHVDCSKCMSCRVISSIIKRSKNSFIEDTEELNNKIMDQVGHICKTFQLSQNCESILQIAQEMIKLTNNANQQSICSTLNMC